MKVTLKGSERTKCWNKNINARESEKWTLLNPMKKLDAVDYEGNVEGE